MVILVDSGGKCVHWLFSSSFSAKNLGGSISSPLSASFKDKSPLRLVSESDCTTCNKSLRISPLLERVKSSDISSRSNKVAVGKPRTEPSGSTKTLPPLWPSHSGLGAQDTSPLNRGAREASAV